MTRKPTTKNSGVLHTARPSQIVASHPTICTPAGTAISMLAAAKKARTIGGRPDGEHVVGPQAEGQEADGDERRDHPRVANEPLAHEDGQDHRDDPGGRHELDVDLRVPEDPEQVLPQQGAATLGRVEELGAEPPVEL